MYVCMYVCMYVNVCQCMYTHTYTHNTYALRAASEVYSQMAENLDQWKKIWVEETSPSDEARIGI